MFIDMARSALAAGGAQGVSDGDLFADNRAVDVAFSGDAWDESVAGMVRLAFADAKVDYAIQPAAPRQKRLLIADMDSTIVTTETLDEMAILAGIGDRIAAITKRAMNAELDFEAALHERVGLLAGKDAQILEDVYGGLEISPGATTLVAAMRAGGADCRLVSGGFKFFTSRVAERLGFDGQQSNDIEIDGEVITGRVLEPILDGAAKVTALERHAKALGIGMDAVVTVGDGSNDIPMLKAAGLGVAWRGKPSVKAVARARIDHGDLSTLLIFQRLDPA